MLIRKKVCILTSVHPPFDTRIFHKEAKSLAKAGYDVALIAQHDKDEIVDGIRIIPLPKPKNRFERMTKTVWQVYRKALKIDADIYHFHDPELIPIGMLLKFKGKKVIYDVHEDNVTFAKQKSYLNKFSGCVIAWLIGLVEKVASHFFELVLAERYYEERFPGQTLVLNYPKNFYFSSPRNADAEYCNALLFTGTVSEDRGALLHASIAREMSAVEVYVVGECSKELAKKMKKTAENGGARLHIEGIGQHVPFERICEYYERQGWLAGIAIFQPTPHNIRKELTKFFEYMAVGLPIICSNFPVWKQLIEENNVGIAVDPGDMSEIVGAIQRLKDYPAQRYQMGENGKQAAMKRYNWKTQEENLIALYHKLLET